MMKRKFDLYRQRLPQVLTGSELYPVEVANGKIHTLAQASTPSLFEIYPMTSRNVFYYIALAYSLF